jgi:hypothetical protein
MKGDAVLCEPVAYGRGVFVCMSEMTVEEDGVLRMICIAPRTWTEALVD